MPEIPEIIPVPERDDAAKEAADRIRRMRSRPGRRSTILGGQAGDEGGVARKTLLGE